MECKIIVKEIFIVPKIGIVITGNITSGKIKNGMKINLDGNIIEIGEIQQNHKKIDETYTQDPLGVSLKTENRALVNLFNKKEITFSENGDIVNRSDKNISYNKEYEKNINKENGGFMKLLKYIFNK